MILAHIMVKTKRQAKEIVTLLLAQKLVYSASITTKKVYINNRQTDEVSSEKQTVIAGKTKALLFSTINEILRTNYAENMPILYAVPIIYMDEEQIQMLREKTAKV